jgi:hypothetical protein
MKQLQSMEQGEVIQRQQALLAEQQQRAEIAAAASAADMRDAVKTAQAMAAALARSATAASATATGISAGGAGTGSVPATAAAAVKGGASSVTSRLRFIPRPDLVSADDSNRILSGTLRLSVDVVRSTPVLPLDVPPIGSECLFPFCSAVFSDPNCNISSPHLFLFP